MKGLSFVQLCVKVWYGKVKIYMITNYIFPKKYYTRQLTAFVASDVNVSFA